MGCHKMLRPSIWWKFHQSCFRLSSQGKHFRMKENHTRSPIKMLKKKTLTLEASATKCRSSETFRNQLYICLGPRDSSKATGECLTSLTLFHFWQKYKYGNCVCTGVWLHLYGSFWVDGIAPYSAHSRIFVLAALSLQFWFLNRNS